MLKLGVNIDHVATLREARYRGRETGEPSLVDAVRVCEEAGAAGITLHLREDRRHIQDRDVRAVQEGMRTRLNLEIANTPEIVGFALQTRPHTVCVVPERRQEVTTEGGLDAAAHVHSLKETRKQMNDAGIEVSLFIAPDPAQVDAAARIGAQFVELHTGQFAEHFDDEQGRERELNRLIAASHQAHGLRVRVNAGHGLNYVNLPVLHHVPHLVELNIGHSIVSRALITGLGRAVTDMLKLLSGYAL